MIWLPRGASDGGPAPTQWNGVKVTPERERVKDHPKDCVRARRFRSHRGKPELFFLHTIFRVAVSAFISVSIHARMRSKSAYIGKKLGT